MQDIIGQWLTSLKHYVLMCLLLSSPDRLPYSPYSIALTVFVYFLLGLLLVNEQHSYIFVCSHIVLELGMLGLIAYWGLRWRNWLGRFPQTFSALAGITMITTAVSIPAYRAIAPEGDDVSKLLFIVTLIIVIWHLSVLSLIFKRSFEISTRLSAMISFNYFVLNQFIVIWSS